MTQAKISLYQIDAFTDRVFGGNPAAVCPLERWLRDEVMQSIAAENNLSETAFFVPSADAYELRWFTPKREVDLCGHATLASAFVIFNFFHRDKVKLRFHSRSGVLEATRENDLIILDLPSRPPKPCPMPHGIEEALGKMPDYAFEAHAYLFVFPTEADVLDLCPDFTKLAMLPRTVIVTAPGDTTDFVSRYFAPSRGVAEDPVTGSAHCTLVPYWAQRLGKTKLKALQVSQRGGELVCEYLEGRVQIGGHAALYLEGEIWIQQEGTKLTQNVMRALRLRISDFQRRRRSRSYWRKTQSDRLPPNALT